VFLSTRVVEAIEGNVKGRIEAGCRLAEVVGVLRDRARAQEEGRAVVLKGMRSFLGV
jgi:hypothetical protein